MTRTIFALLSDAVRPEAASRFKHYPSQDALVKSAPTSLVCSEELMNANATSVLLDTFSSMTRVQ